MTGNMAAMTRSSSYVALTFNSSWTRLRKHTIWVTPGKTISDHHLMDLILLVFYKGVNYVLKEIVIQEF